MSRVHRAPRIAGNGPPPGAVPTAPEHRHRESEADAVVAPRRQTRAPAYPEVLAATTAVLLAVDAYVHVRDAGLYDRNATDVVSQGTLFRAQGVVGAVVAVALVLLARRPVVWAIAALVTAGAAGAVLLYTYVDVGAIGPLPDMYEPTWALPGKPASAVAEAAATVLALTGFAWALAARRGARRARRAAPLPVDQPFRSKEQRS